jgi:hypothetical protein
VLEGNASFDKSSLMNLDICTTGTLLNNETSTIKRWLVLFLLLYDNFYIYHTVFYIVIYRLLLPKYLVLLYPNLLLATFLVLFSVIVEKRYSPSLDQIHLLDKKSTIARVKFRKKDKSEDKKDKSEDEEGSALIDTLTGVSGDKDEDIETDNDAMGESIDAPADHNVELEKGKDKEEEKKEHNEKDEGKENDEKKKKDAKSKTNIVLLFPTAYCFGNLLSV